MYIYDTYTYYVRKNFLLLYLIFFYKTFSRGRRAPNESRNGTDNWRTARHRFITSRVKCKYYILPWYELHLICKMSKYNLYIYIYPY
jgi:hypothetical protein